MGDVEATNADLFLGKLEEERRREREREREKARRRKGA